MTPNAPQKLGRYEILEEIGKGAMGVVYLARDPLIGRQVALKTFRVGFSAKDQELAQFRSRFVREAQSAGILSHPNIVTIHDVVDEGGEGICFIAMEFVKGTNLKQLMQRPETFSYDRLIDILSQIAEGLDYAHSRGVVHRDIKPANILIAQDGKVKITDFGIARLDTSNLTMEGQLLGTPNYMAPEQIQGKEVDHRADIFSLGVVFYEMLTRKKPFQGENLTAVTHKIVYEPFRPAEEIIKDLPPGLTAIMTRCLEKDPSRRYPRAAEIAAELRRSGTRLAAELGDIDDDDTSATQEVPEETVESSAARRPEAAAEAAARPPAGSSAAVADAAGRAPVAPAGSSDAAAAVLAATTPMPRLPSPPDHPPAPATPSAPYLAPPAAPARTAQPAASAAPAAVAAGAPMPTVAASAAGSAVAGVPARAGGAALAGGAAAPGVPALADAPAGATLAAEGLRRQRSQRWIQYALLGLAGLTVVTLLALWATGRTDPQPVAPAGPTAEEQRRLDLAEALVDARQRLDSGDLQGALAALALAQQADPESVAARELRAEIERVSLDLQSAAEREQQVSEGLILAREEFAKRRYEAAVAAAQGVLALVPEHPEAVKLAADSGSALARQKERQLSQKSAREAVQAAAAISATPVAALEGAAPPAPPAPVPADATVEIDFYSEVSEGALTVYSGERQILREPFKFVKKTGFLSKEKIPGAIGAQRTLPAGPAALRVYVSLPGKPTKAIVVEGDLVGGTTRRLVVRVDAEARVSAALE